MSSQDRLENVLRDIHVMISKSEAYDADRIIVSKQDIFDLIDRLNLSIYEIMDEYELTQQSRDKALRENRKEGDKIIWDASRQAEDIYAASVMYTDEALNHLNGIMEEASGAINRIYKELRESMKRQRETIKENQLELKSQLQLLVDTEKYLRLIEDRNKEIEREKEEKKGGKKLKSQNTDSFTPIKPEIRINEEYFRKAGIPIEKEETDEKAEETSFEEGVIESTLKKVAAEVVKEVEEEPEEEADRKNTGQEEPAAEAEKAEPEETEAEAAAPEPEAGERKGAGEAQEIQEPKGQKPPEDNIRVNLNAEYFKWKQAAQGGRKEEPEPAEEENHAEKHTFFDKFIGKKK